jgi:trimeric autotransporter adhesin
MLSKAGLRIFHVFALLPGLLSAQRIITTYAGADWIFPANISRATDAPAGVLYAVTVDAQGNFYAPDSSNDVVYKVDRNGNFKIVAGNGLRAFSGDGGLAVNASLDNPTCVLVDAAGNVFIGDEGNNRIRKITPDGTISTIAGNGKSITAGDGSPALQASFANISGMVLDSAGSLYFTDNTDNRIRRIDSSGIISTFAGTGQSASTGDNGQAALAALNGPWGIALSSAGDLYVTEFDGRRIRKISKGIITTFAGTGVRGSSGDGGPATQANLLGPVGLAFDGSGNLVVGDNTKVRSISSAGVISTIAGNGNQDFTGDGGPATAASFYFAEGIAAAADGTIYVADEGNHRIRSFRPGANISTVLGNGRYKVASSPLPTQTFLGRPNGIRADRAGNLIFTDAALDTLRSIDPGATAVTLRGGSFNRGGCCTDGGSALNALLGSPGGVWTLDDGTIFLADRDNSRIRKITPTGTISSIAGGTGQVANSGFSGDGGPATQARLDTPQDVVVDSKGNIYIADEGNNRVRKIGTDGNISTFAGSSSRGYRSSDDGGAATSAALDGPWGLAVDTSDNIYIADYSNRRIRKVTPGGTITTFAGNGSLTPSPDGTKAVNAGIGGPLRMTFDSAGNLYFSDYSNDSVRRIGADGLLTTIAGNGKTGFSGDGGLATAASLNSPYSVAVGPDGTVYVADSGNNRIRAILPATIPATIQLSRSSLSFSAKSGAAPAAAQVVTLTSTIANAASTGLGFTASVSSNASSWLQVTPGVGRTSQDLRIIADPGKLTAGSYQGTVSVAASGATNSPLTITVSFTVQPGDTSSKLAVDPGTISLSLVQGSLPVTRLVTISNAGSGTLNFQASTTGSPWLSLSTGTGTVAPGAPFNLSVKIDPSTLSSGSYSGRIDVTNTSSANDAPQSIKVFLTVGARPRTILLSQTGLSFTSVTGGGSPLSKNFGILNTGAGSMDWTAKVSAPDGSAISWLQLSATSGTVLRPFLDVSLVDVSIDTTTLTTPGTYLGQIRILSDADNSPQSVTVAVTVLAPGNKAPLEVRPSGLIFTGLQGSNPGSQTVQFATQGAVQRSYRSGTITGEGTNWLVAGPNTGSFLPNQPGRMIIQPDFSTLDPGAHFGTVTVLFLEDGSSQLVNVLAVVAPAGTVFKGEEGASGCTPKSMNIQFPNEVDIKNVILGNPANFETQIKDDCGSAVTSQNASVSVAFRSGDASLSLVNTTDGKWSRTWTPKAAGTGAPATTTATTTAFMVLPNGTILKAQKDTDVTISTASTLPIVSTGGVVNAASFAGDTPLAPGSLITVFGASIANAGPGQSAGTVPVPTALNGTEVRLNDQPLPLNYASDGQINAQIPYGLPVNTQHQILVRRGNLLSAPETVLVAAAQPGIFRAGVADQGVILNVNNLLADSKNPAHANDTVVIYCTGLGAVSPAVDAGQAAPSSPLSRTTTVPTVTIGGKTAIVDFSGLTPNFAGLYQVNARIPTGVTPGDAVPVTLSIQGQTSPVVTIAVR